MIPTDIKLRQKSKKLELVFEGGESYSFAYEFLRVYSPSAEVRGHSPEQAVLQLNKVSVGVSKVDLIGNYALKITFDDGHDTGLYSWDYLRELHTQKERYWATYLDKLKSEGHDREKWVKMAGEE